MIKKIQRSSKANGEENLLTKFNRHQPSNLNQLKRRNNKYNQQNSFRLQQKAQDSLNRKVYGQKEKLVKISQILKEKNRNQFSRIRKNKRKRRKKMIIKNLREEVGEIETIFISLVIQTILLKYIQKWLLSPKNNLVILIRANNQRAYLSSLKKLIKLLRKLCESNFYLILIPFNTLINTVYNDSHFDTFIGILFTPFYILPKIIYCRLTLRNYRPI